MYARLPIYNIHTFPGKASLITDLAAQRANLEITDFFGTGHEVTLDVCQMKTCMMAKTYGIVEDFALPPIVSVSSNSHP